MILKIWDRKQLFWISFHSIVEQMIYWNVKKTKENNCNIITDGESLNLQIDTDKKKMTINKNTIETKKSDSRNLSLTEWLEKCRWTDLMISDLLTCTKVLDYT